MKNKENKLELNRIEINFILKEKIRLIGENLKKFRKSNNMTQDDVAFYIFVDKSLISSLERGVYKNISVFILIKFCKLFNKKIEDFFKE